MQNKMPNRKLDPGKFPQAHRSLSSELGDDGSKIALAYRGSKNLNILPSSQLPLFSLFR